MAADLKSAIVIAIRTSETEIKAFQILGLKVRHQNIIRKTDAGLVCDCSGFRYKGNCIHTKTAGPAHKDLELGGVESDLGETCLTDYTPLNAIYMCDHEVKQHCRVSFALPDISLNNLVWLFTKGEATTSITEAGGVISAARILAECEAAYKKDVTINEKSVQDAGLASGVRTAKTSDKPDPILERMKEKAETAVKVPVWKEIERPNPEEFYVSPEVWQQLCYTVFAEDKLLLVGPSGAGKTEVVMALAAKVCRRIEVFNFGEMQEPRSALIGNTHLGKDGTFFKKSRFIDAITTPNTIVVLDEISRAGKDANNIILPLLDRQAYMALDESETADIVRKAPGVSFFATANVGMEYTGTEALDEALKKRFGSIIDMDFPPKDMEIKILMHRTKCSRKDAEKLVNIAIRQREMCVNDGDFVMQVSTRELLAAGERIAQGMDFSVAVKYSIENQYSSNGGDSSERTKLKQIVQKYK